MTKKTQTTLGVAALIPKKTNGPVQLLELGDLVEDPQNARQAYDRTRLEELASSIKAQGVLQPITVRPMAGGGKGRYVICSGHRRYRASKLAGVKAIPALVRDDLDDKQAALVAATENLQRADLTPYEEARAYKTIQDSDAKLKVADVARICGVAHNTVKAKLQLLEYPEDLAQEVGRKGFSQAHAKLLLPVAKDPKALKIALAAIRGWEDFSGVVHDIAPVDEAADLIAEALIDEGLVVDAGKQAGLNSYGLHNSSKADRLEKVVEKVGGFRLVGEENQSSFLVPATPEAKAALKELKPRAKKADPKEREEQARREAAAARAAEKERELDERAEQLQLAAIVEKARAIDEAGLLAIILQDAHRGYIPRKAAAPVLLAFGIDIGEKNYAYLDHGELATLLGTLGPEDRRACVVALNRSAHLGRYRSDDNEDFLGQDFEAFVKAAKAELKANAKRAKTHPAEAAQEAAKAAKKRRKKAQSDHDKAQVQLVGDDVDEEPIGDDVDHVQATVDGPLEPDVEA
jgi:ParB/RepB/Spo0J family partition protein